MEGGRQPSAGPGKLQFLQDFPFIEFTDDELIKLFEVAGFALGSCYDGKLIVINYLRGLHKDCFECVMADLLEQHKELGGADAVDISSRVMLENS